MKIKTFKVKRTGDLWETPARKANGQKTLVPQGIYEVIRSLTIPRGSDPPENGFVVEHNGQEFIVLGIDCELQDET